MKIGEVFILFGSLVIFNKLPFISNLSKKELFKNTKNFIINQHHGLLI